MTPETSTPEQSQAIDAGTGDDAITMPMPAFVLIPLCMALIVDSAALAAVALLWPSQMLSGVLGAAACVVGLAVGALSIRPRKPRPKAVWPTIVLASHGISMGAVILAAVSLYSSTTPISSPGARLATRVVKTLGRCWLSNVAFFPSSRALR